MPIRADYHMHTPLCRHAAGPMADYVERAIELGLREVGFSDHNPLPRGLSAAVRMREDELDLYAREVTELQFQYRGKIEVRLGLELDYVEGLQRYLREQLRRHPWDYVIGSIHHLDPECRTSSWPRNFDGDVSALYQRYFSLVRKLARSGLCDIIAHFDLPKRSGRRPSDREQPDIAATLDVIAETGLCLEINTSGYRHPELAEPEPYPSFAIIESALARGIPLVVNSDAHAPEQVGLKFDVLAAWLAQKRCRHLAGFDKRVRVMRAL
jgi:histidinol-phosphatase (PHP family)